MPKTTGYAVKMRKSQKLRDERARVENLWLWARTDRQMKREGQWRQSEAQYAGHHYTAAQRRDKGDKIVVNMSASTVNTIVPYVTGNHPSFYIEPYLAPASKQAATYLKAWLNRTWRHWRVNGQEHLETCAHDELIYGDGWMGTFWDIIEEEYEGEAVERGHIWVERISPWDVWMDPHADGKHNARFLAVRSEVPYRQMLDDDRYQYVSELESFSGEPDTENSDKQSEAGNYHSDDPEDGFVTIIEFYDLVQRKLVVFVPGFEYPIRMIEGIDCPIEQLKNYRIPRTGYGSGELENLWSLQQELNKTRSQMITHRQRNVAKFLAREGALNQKAVDSLKSPEINEIIWITGAQSLEDVIKPLDVSQLTADAYQVSDLITRDIYEISGVNEYLRGATPSISRTATEATIIETASNVKSTYKLRQIEKFVRKIGQHMLNMAADVFPTTSMGEFAMVLTGRDAQEMAAASDIESPQDVQEGQMILTEDLFQGEYEVFVETNSTEMRNPRFRAEQYKDVLMTLTQVIPLMAQTPGTPLPDLSKVIELWLEAIGIENIESIVNGQTPPPMMQAGGGPGGDNPLGTQAGAPMIPNASAPTAPLTDANTGALPVG